MLTEFVNDAEKYFYQVLRIRRIEQRIAFEYPKQEMRCPVHLSIGQEGPAVAMCEVLLENDLVVSTHRGHAHYLAKGGNLNALIAEFYGKDAGCSRGYGSSMHLVDRACGFYGSTSIVGGTIPLGVGLAFAKKLRGEKGIVVIFFGDGALEEGVFHESMNFASIHKLPVIFFCENNLYSCYTHLNDRQPNRKMINVGLAHKIRFKRVPCHRAAYAGRVLHSLRAMMERDPEPWLIESPTYRYVEHCGPKNDDELKYRPVQEIAEWLDRDPVYHTGVEAQVTSDRRQDFEAAIAKEIDQAFEFAKSTPFPETTLHGYQYAPTHNG